MSPIDGHCLLRAASLGGYVHDWLQARQRQAWVHGVYRSACSVVTEQGHLITLLAETRRGPLNIVVPGLRPGLSWLQAGDRVYLSADMVRVPRAGLDVDLTDARVWRGPSWPAGPPAELAQRWANACQALEVALLARRPRSLVNLLPGLCIGRFPGPGAQFTPDDRDAAPLQEGLRAEFLAAIQGLRLAGQNRDVGGFLEHGSRLVGLGPGLTPSGDDFLTGFLLATAYLARADGKTPTWYGAAGQELASRSARRTTLTGSRQLWLAAQGEADEVTCRVVTAILWDGQGLCAAVKALLQTGSSSGGDILAGICVATELYVRQVCPEAIPVIQWKRHA